MKTPEIPEGYIFPKHDVLTIDEEQDTARAVVDAEIKHWVALLSYPTVTKALLREIGPALAKKEVEVPSFNQRRWQKMFAKNVRLADAERTWMHRAEALAREIHSEPDLEAADFDDMVARTVGGDSVAYKRYLDRVEASEKAVISVKQEFTKSNLKLVVSVARRYVHMSQLTFADLIQEGNIGLMRGVEQFDPDRGYRFSTYATWWIRHAITRSKADTGREIRIPVHMLDLYHQVSKVKARMAAKFGREPTALEVSKETGIALAKLKTMDELYVSTPYSLNDVVNREDSQGEEWVDMLEDHKYVLPVDRLQTAERSDKVEKLLMTLTPMEKYIIYHRYGFVKDEEELTLQQLGERNNLSRERIRQIQKEALVKMRKQLQKLPVSEEY